MGPPSYLRQSALASRVGAAPTSPVGIGDCEGTIAVRHKALPAHQSS